MQGEAQALQAAIARRESVVMVLGLGAVGLPLVQVLLEAGFAVLAVDQDRERVQALQAGRSPLAHLAKDWVQAFSEHPRVTWVHWEAGQPWEAARTARGQTPAGPAPSVGIVCVPTPLDALGDPDLSALQCAGHSLAQALQGPALVLLESTTYPGTTRRVLQPIFEAQDVSSGNADQAARNEAWQVGRNLWLAFAPERVDPGHGDPAARHSPRLVGGVDEVATELAQGFYEALGFHVQPTSSAEIAEAAKLVENVYRAVNIALVNELKVSLAAQNIDIWEVLDAAQTKSFGFQRFDPGPGAGGSCIPIDPRYLEHFARAGGVPLRLVELAGRIDRQMAEHVVQVLERELQKRNQSLDQARVLLLGVAYKAGVNITTESPALRIAALLQRAGCLVDYYDPWVPGPIEWPGGDPALSIEWGPDVPGAYEACLFLTDHQEFDLAAIAASARLVIDTRGKRELSGGAADYVGA